MFLFNNVRQLLFSFILIALLSACSHQKNKVNQNTLYNDLGGQEKLVEIVDAFVEEISFNQTIYQYFKQSNIKRFKQKMVEHLCAETGGNCQYTGDNMKQVHAGMKITEMHFNLTVELLIKAMNKTQVSYLNQNRLLKLLVPMRKDMLYQ